MGKSVLLVDDEPHIRELGEIALSKDKTLRTLLAGSDDEALQVCRDQHPDLVFLDIMMPGKDGFEVCQELKADASTADIKVVVFTAFAQHSTMERAYAVGADSYMTKPFRPADLQTKAAELLAS